MGHDLVFEHQASRTSPEEAMSREEYVELVGMLRPKVSERLGVSHHRLFNVREQTTSDCIRSLLFYPV